MEHRHQIEAIVGEAARAWSAGSGRAGFAGVWGEIRRQLRGLRDTATSLIEDERTALLRAQVVPIPWVTVGVTGVYGPERDSTDANQRSLLSGDLTIDRGRLILGAELNIGREQQGGGNPTWRGAALTGFVRLARSLGLSARFAQMEDSDGLLTCIKVSETRH